MQATSLFGFDTDLELGKFFPERTGIRIPMHFDYSLQKITPLSLQEDSRRQTSGPSPKTRILMKKPQKQ